MTVKQPSTMVPPCMVESPIRAAMRLPMRTVAEPIAMVSGGPTQVAMSVTRAAGSIPISTVGSQGGRIGPPTWGTTPVTMGQTCMSVARAAGGIPVSFERGSLLHLAALAAIVGLIGIFRGRRPRSGSGAGGAAAVDQDHGSGNCHARGSEVDKSGAGFDGQLHSRFDHNGHTS